MDKNNIADYSERLAAIARDLGTQANGKKVGMKEKFFLGIITRNFTLLQDMAVILKEREENAQTSSFILARCLLDDFITVLYFNSKDFDKSAIVNHTAKAWKMRFTMLEDSMKINNKYFEGKVPGLVTKEYFERQQESFYRNEANNIFLKDVNKRVLKGFPSTSDLVRQLPVNGISAANAHSLSLWQFYSCYIHYSSITQFMESGADKRPIEILQLKEVLLYVYKTVYFCHLALKQYGIETTFNDTTNLKDELVKDDKKKEPVEAA